jgi:quinol-cytochrome oxidoreductase complex cytochrome b subunit
MSGGHSTYVPKTGIGRWFDARLPVPRLVHDQFIVYPVPRNLTGPVTGRSSGSLSSTPSSLGSKPAEGWYIPAMQVSTLYYYAFFLVVMPLLGVIETPRRLPNSISEAILEKSKE